MRSDRHANADEAKLPRCNLLDASSEPHPIINRLMGMALTRLYLHSRVAAFNYERVRAVDIKRQSAPEGFAPSGDSAVTVAKLAHRFDQARTHRARLLLIKEAQTEAEEIEHSPQHRPGTVEWKARIVADARTYSVMAPEYGISPATISRIKQAARKDRERLAA